MKSLYNCNIATSDRGWSPTNRKLLSHPDLQKQVPTNQDPPTDLTDLNLDTGFSTVCIDRIMQHCARNGGMVRRQQQLWQKNGAVSSLEEAKRMTSGILVGNGIHSLNNPRLLERIKSKQQETVDCQIAQV
jgi:hypothetical protein